MNALKKHSILALFIITILLTLSCSNRDKNTLHIVFLTDLHITPNAQSSHQLTRLVEEVNSKNFDLVVVAGDISNQGSFEELINVKNILDELRIPYYMLPGNHETNWSESAGQDFFNLWGEDKFLFRKGDFLFAGLNTGPFMRMGDGHVKQEDIAWLESELMKHMTDDTRLLFFAHYPLAEGLDQWYRITDILNNYEHTIAFCGHGHQQQLMNFDGIPGIMGRSLVLRGDTLPGYNIVKLLNDSLLVYDKIIGADMPEPGIALHVPTAHQKIAGMDITPRPDYSINEEYPQVIRGFDWKDDASVFTGPLLLGDTGIVFGNSKGKLRAVDTRNQNIHWQHQFAGPLYASPVQYEHTIVFGDLSGTFHGIDARTGEINWQLNAAAPIVATGIIDDGYYYGGAGSTAFYKIDALTGEIRWTYEDVNGLLQAQPAIHNNYLVFTAWDTNVYCLDKHSGELMWTWNNDRPVALLSPGNVVPVISNGKVFVVAPDRYMTALDLESGNEVWRTNRHMVRESMGASVDKQTIFAKLMNDTIVAMSAKADYALTKWALDAGFGYDHNPCPIVVKDSILFAATKNGLVMAVDINKRELAWKHKVSNTAVNKMHAGPNNTLWLTTTDGQVLSIKY